MSAGENNPPTSALHAAAQGDRQAAADLLPLLYGELRKLAHAQMRRLRPGQTFQTTALVHEAYLRLVGEADPGWDGRAHFFAAAARAMRQILIESVRRKASAKRGGGRVGMELVDFPIPLGTHVEDLLALDEALVKLEKNDRRKHDIVMLRFFAGLTAEEAANVLHVSLRTVERDWRYARAWLQREMLAVEEDEDNG